MTLLDAIGDTPLVPLDKLCAGLPNLVLAKCEHLNPGGSIKDRIAKAIVDAAEAEGLLEPGMTLIEATAGNTGVGLALVAAARGYALVCVMPEKMSVDKRRVLASLGAELVVTKNAPPSSPDNFQQVARRLAAERGYFLANQFENPANVEVHARTTGPEILRGLEVLGLGPPAAFVAGAGTGGTISGVAKAFAEHGCAARIVLADPAGSGLANLIEAGELGPDGAYAVEGIGSSQPPLNFHRERIHAAITIDDALSFETTRRLIAEQGLLVGGSAGTNVAAALQLAADPKLEGPIVTVLPDSWDRYFSTPWMQAWY